MKNAQRLESVRRWIEGKPPFLVNIALAGAANAKEVHWWLQYEIKQKEAKRKLVIPDPKCWLKFYKQSAQIHIASACLNLGMRRGIQVATMIRVARFMIVEAKSSPEKFKAQLTEHIKDMGEKKFLKRSKKYADITLKALSHDLDQELNQIAGESEPMLDEESKQFGEMMATQEISFYFRVWIPCYILHHLEPAQMLRKARLGDLDMLEALLRIDKMILFDPQIRDQYIKAKYVPNKGVLNRIEKAFKGQAAGNIKLPKVKKGIAKFIHQMFGAMGHDLSVADIHNFFDAIAKAKRQLHDADLVSEEALKKALERELDWPVFSRTKIK